MKKKRISFIVFSAPTHRAEALTRRPPNNPRDSFAAKIGNPKQGVAREFGDISPTMLRMREVLFVARDCMTIKIDGNRNVESSAGRTETEAADASK